ncbi:MAG: hypothetical protein N2999_02665 [Proteobacteria bacterium]|nr:hypothetical protein [Pseudomonadota bacterium]
MRKVVLFLIALLLIGCGGPSKDKVKESIKQILPIEFEIASLKELKEIPGVYEVVIKLDKQHIVFYVDKKAKYIISGSIVETATKKNITLEAQNAYNPPQPVQPPQQSAPEQQQKKRK